MEQMVRPVSAGDLSFLTAMAVAACHDPGSPIPADAPESPAVRTLVEEWGRPGDVGVIACTPEGEGQGAAWRRLLARPLAYARDGSPLPEVTLAVAERWRGQGVGRVLLDELARAAREQGQPALTLKVSHRNQVARRLYERAGFTSFHTTSRGIWLRVDL
jgi:GNAT superfamily N-acetyltransferase